jgi:hypothetical protein
MLFTVTVDMADNGYFEFSTESIFKLAEIARMLGNLDIVDDDEDFVDDIEIPEEIAQYFDDGEEYVYDEDAECYCWYDETHEAWYWLNVETGEWLLVEDEEGFEVDSSEQE